MIAQRKVLLRLPAVYLPRWPGARLFILPYWQTIGFVAMPHRNVALRLTLAVGVLLAAVAIWALMERQEIEADSSSLMDGRNETVVYRQEQSPGPVVAPEAVENAYTEQLEASDEL